MKDMFLHLFNMSITAGWLALAVMLFRVLFKKAPKSLTVVLWALVGVRLLFPVSVESVLSLIPSRETVPTDIMYAETPTIHTGLPHINTIVNPILSETLAPAPSDSVNPMQTVTSIACTVWLVGIAAMLAYTAFSYLRLHLKVREASPLEQNVYLCDHIDTPFLLGIVKPRIYLPSAINQSDIPYVLAHERAHIKRRDYLWKPLGFLLLTVYWFNPVLWLAYVLLCRDIETACDEKVLATHGSEIKKPYANALINCSIKRNTVAACPLAFGEVSVVKRVKSVLHYKKPAVWLIALAVIASIVIAVCFLTDPITEAEGTEESQTQSETPSDEISENEASQPSEEDVFDPLKAQAQLSNETRLKIERAWKSKYGSFQWWNGTMFTGSVRCYGTYGECVVLFEATQLPIFSKVTVAGHAFSMPTSFTLAVFYDNQLIDLADAYEEGLLTEEQIAQIVSIHQKSQFYVNQNQHAIPPAQQESFVLLEPPSEAVVKEINSALQEKFSITREPKWFNGDKGKCVRYYGTYGDCVVIFTSDYDPMFDEERIIGAGGYVFYHGRQFSIEVFHNGELIFLPDAYENGLLSEEQLAEIAVYHANFHQYRNQENYAERINSIFIIG